MNSERLKHKRQETIFLYRAWNINLDDQASKHRPMNQEVRKHDFAELPYGITGLFHFREIPSYFHLYLLRDAVMVAYAVGEVLPVAALTNRCV